MPEHDELREIDGIKPKIWLEDGETREAQSKSNAATKYKIKRTYDHFYCTCPAWTISGAPVNGRSCKHLKELLGEKYENARMNLKNPGAVKAEKPAATSKAKRETKTKATKAKKEETTKATAGVRGGAKRKAKGSGKDVENDDDEQDDEEEEEEDEGGDEEEPIKAKGKARTRSSAAEKTKAAPKKTARTKRNKVEEDVVEEEQDDDLEMGEYNDMAVNDLKTEKENLLKRLEKVNNLLNQGTESGNRATRTTKTTISGKGKSNVKHEDKEDEDEEEEDEDEEDDGKPAAKKKTDLLLAEKWDLEKGIDPTDWYMSEKLDGVRAYWDGSVFRSREGNMFYAPDWFVKKFPSDVTFDGELTAGRNSFQDCVSIVKAQGLPEKWKYKIQFHVFDVPSMDVQPFEERYQFLQDYFKKNKVQWVKVVEQTVCKSKEHLMEELQKVTDEKGEGLMLREPGSLYIGKRSKTLLKVKKFLDDDAEVIGHEGGKGRNTGVCGALKCKMVGSGKEFKVGTGLSDKVRKNPPKIGTIIVYRSGYYWL